MNKMLLRYGWLSVVLLALVAQVATAAPVTWLGATDEFWTNAANWSSGVVPTDGDDVAITNAGATVMLSGAVPASGSLNSLLVSNSATLVFSNWNSIVSATEIVLGTQSVVTAAGGFTNDAAKNNVYFNCSNLTIAAGGKIDVAGKGYICGISTNKNGTNYYNNGSGPGFGHSPGGNYPEGGAYGGAGGQGQETILSTIPLPYGSVSQPVDPGSSGGGGPIQPGLSPARTPGGSGGGAARIEATGAVTVNGAIIANGQTFVGTGYGGGGGSGGSILINCLTFSGVNGVVTANGGSRSAGVNTGNGSGGRIAVNYTPSAQTGPAPSVQFSVNPGTNASYTTVNYQAEPGTLYFPGGALITTPMINMQGRIHGFTSWGADSLVVSNIWTGFNEEGLQLTVTNDLILIGVSPISTATRMEFGGSSYTGLSSSVNSNGGRIRYSETQASTLIVKGNLILTNGASLYVYSVRTNATASTGALVRVSLNTILASSNCWIYPISHFTNGGSAQFELGNLSILDANSGFNADGAGFLGGLAGVSGCGSGAGGVNVGGQLSGGGGYGGHGGTNSAGLPTGGGTYGSSNAPADAGSGGGGPYYTTTAGGRGGMGGGVVRIGASGTVLVKGVVSANGRNGIAYKSGGGAGGSVYISCRRIQAVPGAVMRANGGNAGDGGSYTGAGGGGGGRIAVWSLYDETGGVIVPTVSGGTGAGTCTNGAAGSLVWGMLRHNGTIISIR